MTDKILIDRTALEHAIEACHEVIGGWQSLAPLALLIAATESLDELRASLEQPGQEFISVPEGLSKANAEFWLKNRTAIIDLCRLQGITIATTANGRAMLIKEKA